MMFVILVHVVSNHWNFIVLASVSQVTAIARDELHFAGRTVIQMIVISVFLIVPLERVFANIAYRSSPYSFVIVRIAS